MSADTHWEEVLPETEYPPDLNTVVFTVSPWHCVHVDCTRAIVTGLLVQVCDSTGDPPVQPVGDCVNTVRDCEPLVQVPQAEYVNEVQVVTGGT